MMQAIQVFCGSSLGFDPVYAQAAQQLGSVFAQKKIKLVYGAGNVGLMGIMAGAALAAGGHVTGVIPHFLRDLEVCHEGVTELILTDTMYARKVEMLRLSEGAIALPGGYGTLDELFEVITLVQLKQIFQPVGILNVNGFYDPLLAHFDRMLADGFIRDFHREMILVSGDLEELLAKMDTAAPAGADKWWK